MSLYICRRKETGVKKPTSHRFRDTPGLTNSQFSQVLADSYRSSDRKSEYLRPAAAGGTKSRQVEVSCVLRMIPICSTQHSRSRESIYAALATSTRWWKGGSPGRSAPPATTKVPGLDRLLAVFTASAVTDYHIFRISYV